MASPGGVVEFAGSLDVAWSAAVGTLAGCRDSGACLSRYRQDPASTEEVLALLDAYARRVREVAGVVADYAGEGSAAAGLARQWLCAARLTVRRCV